MKDDPKIPNPQSEIENVSVRFSRRPFARSFAVVIQLDPLAHAIVCARRTGWPYDFVPPCVRGDQPYQEQVFVAWPWPEDEAKSVRWYCEHEAEIRAHVRAGLVFAPNEN